MSEKNRESWKDLEELVQAEDIDGTQALLDETPPTETARMISRLAGEDQEQLLASRKNRHRKGAEIDHKRTKTIVQLTAPGQS